MTNFKKYKDELLSIPDNLGVYDFVESHVPDAKLAKSYMMKATLFMKWLNEEYKKPEVDWSKVPIDTPALVRAGTGDWQKRHFARVDKNGTPYFWYYGKTSWSADNEYDNSQWSFYKLAEEGE